jgi:hypothetical protein
MLTINESCSVLMKLVKKIMRYTLIFYLLVVVAYWIIVRLAYFNWGASKEEIQNQFPVEEFISPNRVVSIRAINIEAPREKIYPWIAQTGQNRGGFNSYYWLENLFGAKMVNAESIHPEWQQPQPGDTVYYGRKQGFGLVSLVKPNEYYSLQGWTFYLLPIDEHHARLLIRYPSMEVRQSGFAKFYYYTLFESLHFIMETGMMMGIKQKAEDLHNHEKLETGSLQ